MNTCKLLSAWAVGLCLLCPPAVAQTPVQKNAGVAVDADKGVIGSIDAVNGRVVISDRSYAFSPLSLIVHDSGRVSGATALRANQKVRFLVTLGGLDMPPERRWTITEMWINEK